MTNLELGRLIRKECDMNQFIAVRHALAVRIQGLDLLLQIESARQEDYQFAVDQRVIALGILNGLEGC